MSLTCGGEPDLYRSEENACKGEWARARARVRLCRLRLLHARRESNKSKGECSGCAPSLSIKSAIALEHIA